MSAISLTHLSCAIGGRRILSDVSLDIEPGKFVGVLGPNGAGKTTLMRLILGLIQPERGQIQVLGLPATRGNAAIGYIPQMRTAFNNMRLCGRDFVASAHQGYRWGLPVLDKAAAREVAWALDTVDATDLAGRPLSELSGGERQRLLLAQALLGRPQLLLLDEPLISLDPHHQRSVVEMVKRVQVEFGMTVLFSAHELNPLLNALDLVLYLAQGQAALGTVQDVISQEVLSRLYGSPIDVVHIKDRIFVMSGDVAIDKEEHDHDA